MTGAPRSLGFRSRPFSTAGRLAMLVLLLLVPGLSGEAQPARPPGVLLADWDVFAQKGCATCHKIRGIGQGTVGPDLARLGSGTGFVEIAAAMWNHVAEMRVQMREQRVEWPRFTPQEFSNVIEFLFTAQLHNIARDPIEGARLFVSKGCERCHATRGSGERAGPLLDELVSSTSSVLMAASMWNHGSQMGDAMDAAGVARSRLAGTELPDIVAYIRTAAGDPRGEAAPLVVGVPDRGERLFVGKGCAGCHAVGAKPSGRGPAIRARAQRATVSDLPGVLWNHGLVVRTLGARVPRLSGQDMADLTAYLHASYYFDPPQGNAARGRRLLEAKGCLGCHSLYNKGGSRAPDFAASNVVGSQLGQLSAMWNHGPFMDNEAKRQGIVLPTLTGHELSDITTYLAGLGGGPRRR